MERKNRTEPKAEIVDFIESEWNVGHRPAMQYVFFKGFGAGCSRLFIGSKKVAMMFFCLAGLHDPQHFWRGSNIKRMMKGWYCKYCDQEKLEIAFGEKVDCPIWEPRHK